MFIIEYKQVSIIVFTEHENDMRKYFRLFRFMLGETTESRESKDYCELKNENVFIRFMPKRPSARGYKAHYVLNLTQDVVFDYETAFPITSIHHYLKDDPKWSVLFE